ncbi:MAG: hypothetical protein LLG16_03890 [Euryarchaeota archaeon]|nr:hypothetical protein [Euryarchaeota archaeon]
MSATLDERIRALYLQTKPQQLTLLEIANELSISKEHVRNRLRSMRRFGEVSYRPRSIKPAKPAPEAPKEVKAEVCNRDKQTQMCPPESPCKLHKCTPKECHCPDRFQEVK